MNNFCQFTGFVFKEPEVSEFEKNNLVKFVLSNYSNKKKNPSTGIWETSVEWIAFDWWVKKEHTQDAIKLLEKGRYVQVNACKLKSWKDDKYRS